jgi:hypothetical protein
MIEPSQARPVGKLRHFEPIEVDQIFDVNAIALGRAVVVEPPRLQASSNAVSDLGSVVSR